MIDLFLWICSAVLILISLFAVTFLLICLLSYIFLSPALHILFARLRKRLFLKKMVKYGKHPLLYPLFACLPVALLCYFVICIINYSGIRFVVAGVHNVEEGEKLFIHAMPLVVSLVSVLWFWVEYLVVHKTTIQMFQDLRLEHISLYRQETPCQLVIFVHYDLFLQAKSGESWDLLKAPIDPSNKILLKQFSSSSAIDRYIQRFDLLVLPQPEFQVE